MQRYFVLFLLLIVRSFGAERRAKNVILFLGDAVSTGAVGRDE
jgi:hypothetical protein